MEKADSKIRRFWRPATLIKMFVFLSIAFICGAFFFIRSGTFLEWVEGRLEVELRNRITNDYTVDIGEIKGNILGSVTIGSVSISKRGEPTPTVVATRKVVLKYNLLGLLSRRFEVKNLEVFEPQIHVVRDFDGSLNLTHILEPRTANREPRTATFDFAAGSIRLNRGKITYLDTQQDIHVAINDISIRINGELNTWDHDGELRIGKGSLTFNGAEKAINNFDADFVLLADGSRLEDFYFTFGDSELRVKGGFRRGESGTAKSKDRVGFAWDAVLNLRLDVSDVQQFLGEDIEIEGLLKAKLEAEGTDSALDIKAFSVSMPTFSMVQADSGRKIALAELAVEGHVKHAPIPTLTLTTLSTQIADGTLAGDGSIALETAPEGTLLKQYQQLTTSPFNYTGQWHATEVQLIPLLSMFVQLPEYLSDSVGHLSSTAKFSGTSTNLSNLKLAGEIALTETTLNEVGIEDSRFNCTIAAGELKVHGSFDGAAIDVTGSFPLEQPDVLDIQATGINFDTLTKIANTADIGGIGTSSATLSSDGILKGVLEVPDATFNDIPLGVLTGNYRYQEGRVFIEDGLLRGSSQQSVISSQQEDFRTDTEVLESAMTDSRSPIADRRYESRATINGTVDVSGEFPAAFSIIANPVYVQHYPKLLLGAEYPVEGELRGELKLDGTLVNLDGRADFSVIDGVAWGVYLDPLTLPLRIEDYNISISDFKITTRGQRLTMNVAVASNADLDLLVESDAPVRFEEIAKAANIADFPFEGEFDVRFIGILRKSEDADFRVELDCSDITYLDTGRGVKHLLGDAYLFGKLVESGNQPSAISRQQENLGTGEDVFTATKGLLTAESGAERNALMADSRYDFQGHGFDGTSRIRGTVSVVEGNPYRFTVESKGIDVAPFLRILHPTLAAVTGTADGRVSVSGTIADLAPAPASTESQEKRVYPYDVGIHIAASQLHYENSAGHRMPFTNAEPIRLHLKDDKWTIETLALVTGNREPRTALIDENPFIQLTGTFDAKTEAMNFQGGADGFTLVPFLRVFGLPDAVSQNGTGGYTIDITGTPALPVLALEWTLPRLTLKTEVSDVIMSDAGGKVMYQDEVLRFEGCAFKFFGNTINVGGTIDVQPETVDNSELHLRVDTIALDLATLPMGVTDSEITGMLEVSMEIGGTLAKPHILLYAETAVQRPINFTTYVPSITLEKLRVDIDFGSESIRIETVEANGQMGIGTYRAQGTAEFSRRDTDAIQFAIDVSASQVEIADYGVASGHVRLSGTGLAPKDITVIGEINELVLDGYDFHLVNSAPLLFRSDPASVSTNGKAEPLSVEIPLQITSPTMRASVHISVGGTLEAPTIAGVWQGTLNEKVWTGNLQYSNNQITIEDVSLKDGADTLILSGVVPFNLAFVSMDLSERHLEAPINLRIRGGELPLDFFPGINTLFSQTDGTVDIDVALQGTTQSPYLVGNVSLEALQLVLKNFHEPIRNMKVRLTAQEDRVDVPNFEFEMGSGSCRLQGGRLVLDGLVPKGIRLVGLRFEEFPIGSTVREIVPVEVMEDIEGHLTVSLRELSVPLDRFFAAGETLPVPQLQEMPSLVDLVAVSNGILSINSVRLAFKSLNRHYDFQDPQPVLIAISDGAVTLTEAFSLENQDTFSIKQTFSDEDRKPEGLLGDDRTISGKTTLRIDAGDIWQTNGEFDVALRVANFDVSALTDTWPLSYRVTGALSGTLQLNGTSENPKITIRRHTSDPAELYLHDVPIDLRWRVRYQNGVWEISKKRYVEVTFGENLLTFSWRMPYQLELIPFITRFQQAPEAIWQEFQQTPMDGILDVIVTDLDMLPFVVPGLGSATGGGNIHVELTGTIEAPQAIGSVSFDAVGLEFPDTGIDVKEAVGEIRLSEKGASITAFDGVLNGGNFSIRGSITAPPDRRIWQTPPVLDVSANVADVVFEQSEAYRANLNSAEFRLHGELLQPYLTGSLNIDSGYYQQNWEIVRDWLTGVSIKEADVALDYPILRDLYLDLDINIPSDFRVLSSITGPTDFEIACLGKLIGPINQPVFTGDVLIRDGKIGLVLQPFEFIEGSTISNRDSFNFDPTLNILLRTPNRIRGVLPRDESIIDIQVYATFTGTLNNPNFTLSAPTATTAEVLTHEDIIAFLLRSTSISRTFGRFTFSVQRPFEEDARYQAEYPLGENMSIKIETNDQGEHGVDIEFKGRF
ncbi:MAG: translocation/assembly module TamB domain-containing protein [Candidatus Poribacteria bacterium]|nr:translocation/assembly module TamB domain-containing protein [Candidatus Poribacteria bacterium]